MRLSQKITIVHIRKPREQNINQDLQFFGNSLGLFGLRDKDKSCYRVFLELLKAAKMKTGLTSDELAERLGLTRGTVVHHLNKLMEAGICVNVKSKYYLREENLQVSIEAMKRDLEESLRELRDVAGEIDKWMGL